MRKFLKWTIIGTCSMLLCFIMSLLPKYEWIDHETIQNGIYYLTDKSEDRVLYFGFENCPWCVEAKPILKEVASEYKLPVHYIDTQKGLSKEQKEEVAGYVHDFRSEYFDEDGNFHFYVPSVMVVKNGKVVDAHTGTVDSHDAHERKMTEEEKEELKDKYEDMLSKIKSWLVF